MTNRLQSSCAMITLLLIAFCRVGQIGAAPTIEPDIVYGHKDGLALSMDVYHPEGEANGAGVLFMVSGGWVSRWAPPEQTMFLFKPLLDAGYTVFAVRHGSSPRYAIPEIVKDVRRSVRFVHHHAERFEVDAKRLGAFGMSAGGHLALMLGTTGDDGDSSSRDEILRASSRVAAVVALVPPTDLRVAVWEAPESLPAYKNFPALDLDLERAKEFSPLVHVTPDDAPSLVVMGGKDELVPPRHGKWIEEAFEREGVKHQLVIHPDSGHGLDGSHQQTFEAMVDWFDQHLK